MKPAHLSAVLSAIHSSLDRHAEEITELDQTIGDGDHLINLQRGLAALESLAPELAALSWPDAWKKIGMSVMSSVGGASGSLYATLFLALAKGGQTDDLASFAVAFGQGVEAMKARGKSDVGEKTMLDVLVPVANHLRRAAESGGSSREVLAELTEIAAAGAECTRDMIATRGRASFLGERARGHLDAGARTAALMLEAIAGAWPDAD